MYFVLCAHRRSVGSNILFTPPRQMSLLSPSSLTVLSVSYNFKFNHFKLLLNSIKCTSGWPSNSQILTPHSLSSWRVSNNKKSSTHLYTGYRYIYIYIYIYIYTRVYFKLEDDGNRTRRRRKEHNHSSNFGRTRRNGNGSNCHNCCDGIINNNNIHSTTIPSSSV